MTARCTASLIMEAAVGTGSRSYSLWESDGVRRNYQLGCRIPATHVEAWICFGDSDVLGLPKRVGIGPPVEHLFAMWVTSVSCTSRWPPAPTEARRFVPALREPWVSSFGLIRPAVAGSHLSRVGSSPTYPVLVATKSGHPNDYRSGGIVSGSVTFDGAPPPGTINLGIGQRRQPRQLPPSAFCALQRE